MLKSRIVRFGVVAALLGAVAGASAWYGISAASIPDPSGVIHGCYKTSGTVHALNVINSTVTANCPSGYKSLQWVESGDQSSPGPDQPIQFSSPGTYSFVDPSSVTSGIVDALGAGGGGGGGAGNVCNSGGGSAGGGGGGGGYVSALVSLVPGDTYTVVVGTGGTGGPGGTNGTVGECSGGLGGGAGTPGSDTVLSFGDNVIVDAGGGQSGGGAVVGSEGGSGSGGTGGAGGQLELNDGSEGIWGGTSGAGTAGATDSYSFVGLGGTNPTQYQSSGYLGTGGNGGDGGGGGGEPKSGSTGANGLITITLGGAS